MGNKQKTRKRPKKRQYRENQKHMMEVINKKMRLQGDDNSHTEEPEPERQILLELQNVTLDNTSNLASNIEAADVLCERSQSQLVKRLEENNTEVANVLDERLVESDAALDLEVKELQLNGSNIGRRIISVSHFYKKLQEISNHGPLGCSLDHIDLVGEKQNGLTSKFTFQCRMCNLNFYIESDSNDDHYLPVNSCAVAGIMSIGGGHSHLEEICSSLNLPIISNKNYQNIHEILSTNWDKVAQDTMNEAAKKERDLAIAEGRLSKDGIPIIDVCVDGCYSKRSYKKNYSALSGAGAIIGKRTGEILYLGVRNKYCFTCDRAEKSKSTVKEHKCFKNYTGPSTGMESEIIVEGFKQSIETHNLIYGRLISDGDSSTYNKILQAHPYDGITVEKIECRNHLLRNFCNKLQALQTDTKYPVKQRKMLTKTVIMSMRSVIKKVIAKNKNDECPDIQKLFDDICLSHHHAFGNHSRCKSYFCEKENAAENVPNDLFLSSLWQRISILVQNIAGHARSLIHDLDSNVVERYHSVIAKYVGGKRINFSLKQSYATRCKAAAVSFNTNKSLSRLNKNIVKQSPQGKLKMIEERRERHKKLNTKYLKKKRRLIFKRKDENYGENCQKPDMPPEVMEKMKESFLISLQKTDEERKLIERKTILQKDCSEWMELRRTLLTASNFGRVIKRKSTTKCGNLVKNILYKSNLDHVSSIKHGQENEKTAINQLEKQENIKIEPCGLFIDGDMPYFGATPDGLLGEDTIIEIKCPITAFKLGLTQAIAQKKVNFWAKKEDGTLKINTNHNWYHQIQGQLHITKRKQCMFAVWSGEKENLMTEIIKRDDTFWEKKMQDKLKAFYMTCLLPEIIDPRFPRNLSIREPGHNTHSTQDTGTSNIYTRSPLVSNQSLIREPGDNTHSTQDTGTSNTHTRSPLVSNQSLCQPPSCSRSLNFNEI